MSGASGLKAMIFAVALFVAGGVCGLMLQPKLFPPAQSQTLQLGRTNEIVLKIQAKLTSRLQLTPSQISSFQPLIVATSQKLENAHSNCLADIELAIQQFHDQLRPSLTAQQLSELKDLDRERADSMEQKYNFHLTVTNHTN